MFRVTNELIEVQKLNTEVAAPIFMSKINNNFIYKIGS